MCKSHLKSNFIAQFKCQSGLPASNCLQPTVQRDAQDSNRVVVGSRWGVMAGVASAADVHVTPKQQLVNSNSQVLLECPQHLSALNNTHLTARA